MGRCPCRARDLRHSPSLLASTTMTANNATYAPQIVLLGGAMRAAPRLRRAAIVAAVGALTLLVPSAAAAHGDESNSAQVLVVDALAYLANQPDGYMDHVADKINDALEAPDTDGVDLAKVTA